MNKDAQRIHSLTMSLHRGSITHCCRFPTVRFVSALSWLFLAMALHGQLAIHVLAAELTMREQTLLRDLDNATIAQCLAVAAKVEAWRRQLHDLDQRLNSLPEDEALSRPIQLAWDRVRNEILTELRRLSAPVRQAIEGLEQLEQQLQRQATEVRALRQQVETVRGDLLSRLETIRNPAQYARGFIEGELIKYASEPYKTGELSFRIQKTDPARSVFAEEANIEILIEYQQDLRVTARGLYFSYRPGQALPEPRLEKLAVDSNALQLLQGQALKFLGSSGESFPDLGLPIKISNVQANEFALGSEKPGALRFDVEIGGFLELADTLSFKSSEVTLETNGKVSFPNGLTVVNSEFTVPLGTTPLLLHGYEITLRPDSREETLTLKTFFATAAGGNRSLAMDVSATLGLPLDPKKGIVFAGNLVVGPQRTPLGEISLKLSRDEVTGEVRIPAQESPIPDQVLKVAFNFKLDNEGLTGNGMGAVFGLLNLSMDMALRFDGSGHLQANEEVKIGPAYVQSSLLVEISEGMRELSLEATMNVGVDLKLFRADAAVAVRARWPGKITVLAEVAGIAAVEFEVASLDAIDSERIARELLKNIENILQNIAVAAARWERHHKELLAKWENHWRESIHNEAKRYGLDAWQTGNPTADRLLGDISREGKVAGAWVSDVWKKSGGEATNFVKNPGQTLSKLPSNLGRELLKAPGSVLPDVGGALNDLFGRGNRSRRSNEPSPEETRAAEVHEETEQRLAPFVEALHEVRIHRRLDKDRQSAGTRYVATDAGLDVRFDTAAGASEGKGNATAGVTLLVASYRSTIQIGTSHDVQRNRSSAASSATVEFRPLIKPDDQSPAPKAKIDVDAIADVSEFGAEALVRFEIQRLIERFLPEVELEGPRFLDEKMLAVRNGTDEPITVWVQAETVELHPSGRSWSWRPGSPGTRQAERLTLQPGERQLVRRTILADSTDPQTSSSASTSEDTYVRGRTVRVWAQGASGEHYKAHRYEDLPLVEPNPQHQGRRVYFADQLDEFTYDIKPTQGQKLYAERRVTLKNAAPETLRVRLRYRNMVENVWQWAVLPEFSLAPGETLSPVDTAGMQILASQIQVFAEGDQRRYSRHQSDPVWLIDDGPTGRIYGADKVGTFRYDFEPLGANGVSQEAMVRVARANIQVGAEVVGTAQQGQKLKVLEDRGNWIRVAFAAQGEEKVGFILKQNLTMAEFPDAKPPPTPATQTARVRANNAPLMQGSATLGRLSRGEEYAVLETKGNWIRVERMQEGVTVHGWVNRSQVDVR